MGSIVEFNYFKPGVEPGTRVILLLTGDWLRKAHGLKVSGLTSAEIEYLREIFAAVYKNPEDLNQQVIDTSKRVLQAIDILKQKRLELIQQQNSVVMRPVNQGMMGQAMDMAMGAAQKVGSMFGRVSTFGQTQKEPIPQNQNQMLQQEIAINEQAMRTKQEEYAQLVQHLQEQKKKNALIGKTPRDPYSIYHENIKTMFPPGKLPHIYRKYDRAFISGERVVSMPEGVTLAT